VIRMRNIGTSNDSSVVMCLTLGAASQHVQYFLPMGP